MMASSGKPWGGRFAGATAELMERFNASISFDHRLLEVDVAGSKVYARALVRADLLTAEEGEQLVAGLDRVRDEFARDGHVFEPSLEDIHMAVEGRLTELIGPLGGKLHTGRSRNDQVNLDTRLYLRVAVAATLGRVRHLQQVLVHSASQHLDTVMPGYTHLQQAQPILFAHYALSLFWALERDASRLQDAQRRADRMPLGSGALAGSAFALDREFMAQELGFSAVTPNSLDAVSDRDFLLEALAGLSILMTHLSRYCEDLILWSSAEFAFVELDDAYATGSSMMPQKKNADVAELARGRAGRTIGELVNLLTNLKGQPMTYNRDLQEDKQSVMNSAAVVLPTLAIFSAMMPALTFNTERMRATAGEGFSLTTDLADYLVRKGMPFREAHAVTSALVQECERRGCELNQLPMDVYASASALFEPDILEISVDIALAARDIPGGTAPKQVRKAAAELLKELDGR